MPRPTFAEVDLGALRRNFLALREHLAPGVKMLAIVKADAYGHGAAETARTLEAAGADMFGVAMVEEGLELRRAGIRRPILVVGSSSADEVPLAMESDLALTVPDVDSARAANLRAARCHGALRIHLKIDTGMNRLGVRAEEASAALSAIAKMKHLMLEGAYTHLACADDDDPAPSERQLARLRGVLDSLPPDDARRLLIHSANSAAILSLRHSHFGMVRAGLAIYGVAPYAAASAAALQPALTLRSRLVHLKRVRKGEGVSYGHTWRAPRDSVVGLLPIGYADGYRRALSNKAKVRIGGRLCPVVGAVCMDATLVDLTALARPTLGMDAVLLEADPASPLSAAALARLSDTIPYEILTGISRRVPRVYLQPTAPATPPSVAAALKSPVGKRGR